MITKRGLGLYFLGLSHLALGEVEKAEKTAKQLQNLITTNGYPKGMRRYFLLMGRIFQHKGLLSPAIENFKKGVSLLSRQKLDIDEHALYIESLAFAQYQNKDYNNAIQNFKKIIYLTIGRLRWGDIYARSYYWLGKIYQATAMKEEAVKCYQQFLQLWKNADPGIAELKDARTQLALLRRMRGMH